MRKNILYILLASALLVIPIDAFTSEVKIHQEKGKEFANRKQYEKAIQEYKEVLKIKPDSKEIRDDLYNAYLGLAGEYIYPEGYDRALQIYNEMDKIFPNDIAVRANIGAVYLYKRDYDRAIIELENAIALYKLGKEKEHILALAYNSLGKVYQNKEEYNQALEKYKKAVTFYPIPAAYYNMGQIYTFIKGREEYDKAVEVFEKAFILAPYEANFRDYIGLMRAYLAQEEYNKAEKVKREAEEKFPNEPGLYLNFGQNYYKFGQKAKAFFEYLMEPLISQDSPYVNDANRFFTLTLKEIFNDSSQEGRDEVRYCWQGLIYKRDKEYDKAIKSFLKSLALNPNNALLRIYLGETYSANGDYNQAIKEFNKVVEVMPKFAPVYFDLGLAYGGKGELNKTILYYKKAIEVNPDSWASKQAKDYIDKLQKERR